MKHKISKEKKIRNFNPNDAGSNKAGLFGLPFNTDEAEIVIVPVPWEVTVSYSPGTAKGPEAILEASKQIDLYDPNVKDAWKIGVVMDKIDRSIQKKSTLLRKKSERYIGMLTDGKDPEKNAIMKNIRKEINQGSKELNAWVKSRTEKYLKEGKIVATLGGDHSTPLGLMQALAGKYDSFAIFQLDAHADLRNAFEGFEFSHASIMFNAIKIPQVSKLVQVGIRDYCEEEVELINNARSKIKTYFDRDIKQNIYSGKALKSIYEEIINELPQNVFVSFDIDALDPKLCPGTGTPVPGGFEFEQALFLLELLVKSGRKIIGFDLNEVAPGDSEWNANVGGRLLYRMANLAAKSQKRT
jgi:agmatinase